MASPAGWTRRVKGIAQRMGVGVERRGDGPAYMPVRDTVELPRRTRGAGAISLLHELAHATGHRKRLGREASLGSQSRSYAREEIVAQLTADRVAKRIGMPPSMRRRFVIDGAETSSGKYVKFWAGMYGRNPRDPRPPPFREGVRGTYITRTSDEAASIMKDVRAAADFIVSHARGRRLKRALPVRGGGA